MYRPAGWVMLLVGMVVAYAGYLGYEHYPASLSAIPYRDELLPFLVQKWSEQRELYAPLFESKFAVFVLSHPMEIMGWYGGMGLFLLLSREYRNAGWEQCLRVLWYGIFIPILFFFGLIVAHWGFDIFQFFNSESTSSNIARMRTDPTGWLGNWAGGLFIGVYLTVPHPAESAYRAGMANRIPIPELARTVADAMYQHDHLDYDALPKAWKSKNWKKRIDAFHDRLQAEDRFMEELIKNLRLKSQFPE